MTWAPPGQLDSACGVGRSGDVGQRSVGWVLGQGVEGVVCHIAVSVDLEGGGGGGGGGYRRRKRESMAVSSIRNVVLY